MVWALRLGGARCSLVGSSAVRFGEAKARDSWRGSARCGAVMLGQLWQRMAWYGFHGLVRYGQVRRVMVGRGYQGIFN